MRTGRYTVPSRQTVENAREPPRQRDHRAQPPAPPGEPLHPRPQDRPRRRPTAPVGPRGLDEQPPHPAVTRLREWPAALPLAGTRLARHQPDVRRHLARARKAAHVIELPRAHAALQEHVPVLVDDADLALALMDVDPDVLHGWPPFAGWWGRGLPLE